MTELSAKIESLLFFSARPVSFKKLGSMLEVGVDEVKQAIEELVEYRNVEVSGIHVLISDSAAELVTNPAFGELLSAHSKQEFESNLTPAQLETLTIIAYRGPVTKPEMEYIRGVNCTVILRNLLMRGLIVEKKGDLQPAYILSTDMLKQLGLHRVEELPDYETLHKHAKISELLDQIEL